MARSQQESKQIRNSPVVGGLKILEITLIGVGVSVGGLTCMV